MNRRVWQLEMALIVVFGAWAGPAMAQAPPTPTPAPQQGDIKQTYAVVPVIPHPSSPEYVEPSQPERGPLRRLWHNCCTGTKEFMQRQGFCCWDTHNSVGCGSMHADLTFIFGSCRQFFGESCLQPPLPNADNRLFYHPDRSTQSNPYAPRADGAPGCAPQAGRADYPSPVQ
jgi:hypothetical protein